MTFLHRVPFAIDALTLGFLPGFREDCTYQQSQFDPLECPMGMLDNDFQNPDLDRYVDRALKYEPDMGVIGDAYDAAEAQTYVDTIRELQGSQLETEFIIVPKCRTAIEAIPDDIVLGYSRGYAETLAHEFSDPVDWRGRRVHILGGSPPKQLDIVEQLTQPTLTDDPPADIVGLDQNGLHREAQFGEFWTPGGWDDSGRDADHITVRHSLCRLKNFWQVHGVWLDSPSGRDRTRLFRAHARRSRERGVYRVQRECLDSQAGPVRRGVRHRSNLWVLQLRLLFHASTSEQP